MLSSQHKPEAEVMQTAVLSYHLCFPNEDIDDEFDFGTKTNHEVVDDGESESNGVASKNNNHRSALLLKRKEEVEAEAEIKDNERSKLFQEECSDQTTFIAATNDSKSAKQVIRGGVRKVKLCSSEGCSNQVQSGGVCRRHGAKAAVRLCNKEGCTKYARGGEGVCMRHGANVTHRRKS